MTIVIKYLATDLWVTLYIGKREKTLSKIVLSNRLDPNESHESSVNPVIVKSQSYCGKRLISFGRRLTTGRPRPYFTYRYTIINK